MNQSKFSVTSAVIVLIPVQYVYEDFPLPSLQPLPPKPLGAPTRLALVLIRRFPTLSTFSLHPPFHLLLQLPPTLILNTTDQ